MAPFTPGAQTIRPVDDLSQVLEQGIAAMLGRLDDATILLAPKRERVRPADPTAQQPLHRAGHGPWIGVGVAAELGRLVG